ncbi:PAAR domain-containing protein [Trinickia mobilis]|uniref:PAAR domain-containing protein n=1 Tax=Trinickia mobilis TaxID=2816356 RepID=UPI001A8DAE18|nr:PAAR domain-containing protein [Trinickia mobilis]
MPKAGRLGDSIAHGGSIVSGSGDVFINGKPAGYANGSATVCSIHGGGSVSSGASTVFVNGFPAAIIGGSTGCGAEVVAGSPDVSIEG